MYILMTVVAKFRQYTISPSVPSFYSFYPSLGAQNLLYMKTNHMSKCIAEVMYLEKLKKRNNLGQSDYSISSRARVNERCL